MSRRHDDEHSFGSDSFLDVVANIVGILIILIVVAGVRVSRAPLLTVSSDAESTAGEVDTSVINSGVELLPLDSSITDAPIDIFLTEDPPPKSVTPEIAAVPEFVPPPDELLPAVPEIVRPARLMKLAEELEADVTRTQETVSATSTKLSDAQKEQAKRHADVARVDATVREMGQKVDESERLVEILKQETANAQKVVDQLLDQLRNVEQPEPETEKLAHRLNPVGRIVTGDEVHFQLIGNRVFYVPVKELSELVKADMQRRKEFLFRQPRFQSTVGPVQGFEMEYLVQRRGGSMLEGPGLGTGMVSISLTDWVIHPMGSVSGESYQQAVVAGSQFQRALVSEGTNATITFWVYPDSFQLHHQLKDLVQNSGFWVASRPLPMGVKIQGSSSNGSKSVAQ